MGTVGEAVGSLGYLQLRMGAGGQRERMLGGQIPKCVECCAKKFGVFPEGQWGATE